MPSFRSNSYAVALAAASVFSGQARIANAGETVGAATVSLSGSTAMRAFTISPSFTALTPGQSVQVGGQVYNATNTGNENIQLAPTDLTTLTTKTSTATTVANFLAFRVEWHEQGSVEGIAELTNDQVGYFTNGPVVDNGLRNPVASPGNAIYLQRAVLNSTPSTPFTGFTLNGSTYDTYSNFNAAGSNLQGGQNRVQMAISDVRSVQGFSVAGTSAVNRKAGEAGYGKGNPVLRTASTSLGLGSSNVRRQLIDQSALNMDTTKTNPSTVDPTAAVGTPARTGSTYAAGPWNTAGIANTDNKIVAVTATTFAANPGTGLTDLNKSDAQWMQTTGRLANGADFNVVTRDINSGTLNVAANNVGIDPSYAVGENDAGNGLRTDGVNETVVGANIKFSGKTAGGAQLRPTVQNARMAVGHLSLGDVQSVASAGAVNPLRALGFRNTLDNTGAAVKVGFDSISNGSYALFQNETYVTIKDPTNGAAAIAAYKSIPANAGLTDAQAWAALTDAQTGAKGDSNVHNEIVGGNTVKVGDTTALRNNILNSATTFPDTSAFRTPANGLVTSGFIPTNFMQVLKAGDGETPVANPNFNSAQYAAVKAASGTKFVVDDASTIGSGASSSSYGGVVPVTANNYLFGEFNGDAKRDFSDLAGAVTAQTALGADTGVTSGNTAAASGFNGFTKGDLIVKGDYNADGKFDGRDLGAMARGTALADAGKTAAQLTNAANGTLTTASGATASDQYRGGTLYKNAALDYLQANATPAQKLQATASAANDASGANAFNKFDVNRDGLVNRQDAAIVDGSVGKDYRNLNDQLGAVVATNVNAAGTVFIGDPTVDQTTARKSFSLVDAELTDNGVITTIGTGSDFGLIRGSLGASLLAGDANFDGTVNGDDFGLLASNFGSTTAKWSLGDFNLDGAVNGDDFGLLASDFGQNTPGSFAIAPNTADWNTLYAFGAEIGVSVPEPTGLSVIGGLSFMFFSRRSRRNQRA